MRNRKNQLLILSILCLITAACEKDDLNLTLCNPEKYLPLSVGNYWIFKNSTVYNDGTIDPQGTDSLYIDSDSLMLGYHFYHMTGDFNKHPENIWLAYIDGQVISKEGYVYFDGPRMFDSQKLYPIAHFDYPATLNTIRKDSLIRVPAGDFNPVMLFEGHSMVQDTIWVVTYKFFYARDVGLVKFIARSLTHDFENISELVRYHLN